MQLKLTDMFDNLYYMEYKLSLVIKHNNLFKLHDLILAFELYEHGELSESLIKFQTINVSSKLGLRIKLFYINLITRQLGLHNGNFRKLCDSFISLHQEFQCWGALYEAAQCAVFFDHNLAHKYYTHYYSKFPDMLSSLKYFEGNKEQLKIKSKIYEEFVEKYPNFHDISKIGLIDKPSESKIYDNNDILMFNPYPYDIKIGDSYLIASMLKHIKSEFNREIIIFTEQNKIELYQSFNHIDVVYNRDYYTQFIMQHPRSIKFSLGRIFHLSISLVLLPNRNPATLRDLLAMKLGLPNGIVIEPYTEKPMIKFQARQIFAQYGLKQNKTIMIFPDSITIKCSNINDEFWLEIADFYQNLGFDIIFNLNQENFYGYKTCFLPLLITPEFAEICGFVISIRSGIIDVIANQKPNLPLITIYDKQEFDSKYSNLNEIYGTNKQFEFHDENILVLKNLIHGYIKLNF